MKTLCLTLAALALTSTANAATFTPANANPITITGLMKIGNHPRCAFTLNAASSGGIVTILSGTACNGVAVTRMPWTWSGGSYAKGTAHAWMSFTADGTDCGYHAHKLILAQFDWLVGPSKYDVCMVGNGQFTSTPSLGLAP